MTDVQRIWLSELMAIENKASDNSNSLAQTANKVFGKRR